MEREFGTKQVEAQPIVGIREKTTMDRLPQVIGALFGEVHGHIVRNGQSPVGMPLAIYHAMSGNDVDLECALPVASPMAGAGRVRAGALPAGTMATVTHMGPYDGLGETWAALTAWMKSEGHAPGGAPWEVYVTDPGAEPDQSKWRTDIFFPVRCD